MMAPDAVSPGSVGRWMNRTDIMTRLAFLAALPIALACSPALAQSQDGCPRIASSMSLVIVVPKQGCGTAQMAAARNENGPHIVYGAPPPAPAVDNAETTGSITTGNAPVIIRNTTVVG